VTVFREPEWSKLNDITSNFNSIEQRLFEQEKTGKTGSRLHKNIMTTDINKYQNQTNFCLP